MIHTHCKVRLALFAVALCCAAGARAQTQTAGINPFACGPLNPPGQYGPFDYRKDADKLQIVQFASSDDSFLDDLLDYYVA